ncbi:MAG: hypothetical protein ACPLQS_05185 [Desulfurococcaceae archaeon]
MLSIRTKRAPPNKVAYSRPTHRHYSYGDLRDIPISRLTEAQFRYVVKTLLEASMCKACSESEGGR